MAMSQKLSLIEQFWYQVEKEHHWKYYFWCIFALCREKLTSSCTQTHRICKVSFDVQFLKVAISQKLSLTEHFWCQIWKEYLWQHCKVPKDRWFLGDLNDEIPLAQKQAVLRHSNHLRQLFAKSSAPCGGQDFNTNSGLNGQFVVF